MTKRVGMSSGPRYAAGMTSSGTIKFDKKPYILAIVILAVLMVAGVTFGIIGVVLASQKVENVAEIVDNDGSGEQLETVELLGDEGEMTELVVRKRDSVSLSDEKAVKTAVSGVRNELERVLATNDPNGASPISILNVYDESMSTYRPDGLSVMINLDQSYGLLATVASYAMNQEEAVQRQIASDETTNAVIGALRNEGFSEYNIDGTVVEGEYINDQGVICEFRGNAYPLTLACGHTSWIGPEVAQFVKQVSEQSGYDGLYLYATSDNIVDSSYAPYQRLQATIFGAAGLFYRVSPDDPWQFFSGAQTLLGCEQYNTDDLRRAFAGEVCFDAATGQENTVQP